MLILFTNKLFSNIFTRQNIAGEFQAVCRTLILDLVKLGLWNDEMKEAIIRDKGEFYLRKLSVRLNHF